MLAICLRHTSDILPICFRYIISHSYRKHVASIWEATWNHNKVFTKSQDCLKVVPLLSHYCLKVVPILSQYCFIFVSRKEDMLSGAALGEHGCNFFRKKMYQKRIISKKRLFLYFQTLKQMKTQIYIYQPIIQNQQYCIYE